MSIIPVSRLRHEDCEFEASMAYTRVLALSQKAQMITITIIMIAIERNVSRCGEMWLRGMCPQLVSTARTVPQGNLILRISMSFLTPVWSPHKDQIRKLRLVSQRIPQSGCHTWPQSPVTQRGGGQRPRLQRMRAGGLFSSGHCAAGNVLERSLLLHRTIRCLNPGPHFGVHWK